MAEELTRINDVKKKDRPILLILLFIPCIFALFRNLDNDIWFLLTHGRYVLEKGIPYIEPFTLHKGFEFVMQQWLTAVIFWITYSAAGAVGLKILSMVCYGLIVFIFYKLCMKISDDYFFVSYAVTFAASIVILLFMVTRPYIFSTLIFVLELYVLESYIKSNKRRYLIFLPVLSLLLINMHAAMWPLLLLISIPYIIDSFKFRFGPLYGQGYKRSYLILAVLLSTAAGFINPYGYSAMTYLFRSYGYPEIQIVNEMKPAGISTPAGMLLYGSIMLIIFIFILYKKGSTRLRYTLLTLGTGYMAVASFKSFLIFAVCGIFPLAYFLKNFEPVLKKNRVTKKTLLLRASMAIIIIFSLSAVLYSLNDISKKVENDYSLLDKTIHDILNEKDQDVILYTGYNDGGMAEFYGLHPYIDPRAEVFVKNNNKQADVMKEYVDLEKGKTYYKDFLDEYKFTHLIIDKNDILSVYLKHDNDYKITYSNELYTLYERK